MVHRPLSKRERPLSSDVADAIEGLVPDVTQLPIALDQDEIVEQLVVLAQTDETGAFVPLPRIAKVSLSKTFKNVVANGYSLQAGYKHYERRTENLVVPVLGFFFTYLYTPDTDLHECLVNMDPFAVNQSLPRPSHHRVKDKVDNNEIPKRGENGEVITAGTLEGIVIVPANSNYLLATVWLERLAKATCGQLESIVDRIGYATPDRVDVVRLQEQRRPIRSSIQRALPKPKKYD
jgi:hypothetical protein